LSAKPVDELDSIWRQPDQEPGERGGRVVA
jgi:hypothetical protein